MSIKTYSIREIQFNDNQKLAEIIREVLIEFGVPKVGTAYEDMALNNMFNTYDNEKSRYFVVSNGKEILGGAGIMHLQNSNENICELQKMYFTPEVRGRNIGSKMMKICLQQAKNYGYEKCYLETLPYMIGARKLYQKVGFKSLDAPLGDTGHYSCNMWMIKDL